MTTRIANVIVPEVFNPYVVKRTNELSALYQSGIVAPVGELEGALNKGNRYFNMPFWKPMEICQCFPIRRTNQPVQQRQELRWMWKKTAQPMRRMH